MSRQSIRHYDVRVRSSALGTSRAAAAQGDRDALCLMGEINRAATVPDRALNWISIVTMGLWVTF